VAAVAVVVAAAVLVSSDNKAYPTLIILFHGCFGLGYGNLDLHKIWKLI
jgi:dienelactone hydrolase